MTEPAKARKGARTRERILDLAEAAVLQKGFGATSIEEVIAEAEITKSGFFYHFKDKNELARALLKRYLARDDEIMDEIFARARELTDDPLHAFLVGLKMFAEMMADLPDGHPGCLVATYCYHERLFDREVCDLNASGVLAWRERFRAILDEIATAYPPREEVDMDALADMVSSIIEGGIIIGRVLKDPKILADQVMAFRTYVKLLFQPERAAHLNG